MSSAKREGDLSRLVTAVAARQDREIAEQRAVDAARERLFAGSPSMRGRATRARKRTPRVVVAAFAAVAVAACLFLVLRPAPAPSALHFDVGTAPGALGAWIGASSATPLPIHFSNGASVVLAEQSRARIASVSPHGATVQLERGRLTVAIPHEAGTDWHFGAGPYDVKVIGTRFDVSWDAQDGGGDTFTISLAEGTVEVRGPGIDGARRVTTGDSLRLTTAEPLPAQAPTELAAPPAPPPPDPAASALPPSRHVVTPPPPSPTWASLARDGSYREAFALAEKRGFDGEVARASAADLLLLGDASRYAGNPGRAHQCYAAVRATFGGSPEASRAAFRLGVLAFPATSAVALFEEFLREQPDDPLASEALGRILEIDDKAGDVNAARTIATRYLATYPDGAHARLAHGILGR
jgi:transmembrane sensor